MSLLERFVVEIHANDTAFTEKGWGRLLDALTDADLEGTLHDAVADAVTKQLPSDFPDAVQIRVERDIP